MSNYVYKVNHIYNDKINTIIIYYGKKVKDNEKQMVMESLLSKWEMENRKETYYVTRIKTGRFFIQGSSL